jgi:hypothetical protein
VENAPTARPDDAIVRFVHTGRRPRAPYPAAVDVR